MDIYRSQLEDALGVSGISGSELSLDRHSDSSLEGKVGCVVAEGGNKVLKDLNEEQTKRRRRR